MALKMVKWRYNRPKVLATTKRISKKSFGCKLQRIWAFNGTSIKIVSLVVKLTFTCTDEYVWYEKKKKKKTIAHIWNEKKREIEKNWTNAWLHEPKPCRALTDASNDTLHVYWIKMDDKPCSNWFSVRNDTATDHFNSTKQNGRDKSTFNFITGFS